MVQTVTRFRLRVTCFFLLDLMDPVAHTLFGATLAETGLKRTSRYSAATLIIGANLPDIDGLSMFWGSDASLYFRRGWTHGVLSLIILPLFLAGGVWLWHRWRSGGGGGPPFKIGNIIGLSYLAVLSHPALDWLNTYGVRVLMPFDGTWFYGDTLFVVDPWFWLLVAASVVLANSRARLASAGWIFLAAAASLLILFSGAASNPVKLVWFVGLTVIVALRLANTSETSVRSIARGCLVTLLIYISATYGLARMTEASVSDQYPGPMETQANPLPGIPYEHRVVAVYANKYRVVRPDGSSSEFERREPDQIVQTALSDPSIRGFKTWMRYPYWEVTETGDGFSVNFYDLRYAEPGQPSRGIGHVRVLVPR